MKVGYNLFKGASAAGINDGTTGDLQVETSVAGEHKVRVQRLSDNYYWNATTGAFQSGAPAEANELSIPGSDTIAARPAVRRLAMKLPKATVDDIDSDGCVVTVYQAGELPSTGTAITLAFELDA